MNKELNNIKLNNSLENLIYLISEIDNALSIKEYKDTVYLWINKDKLSIYLIHDGIDSKYLIGYDNAKYTIIKNDISRDTKKELIFNYNDIEKIVSYLIFQLDRDYSIVNN